MSAQITWTIDWLNASTQTINGHSEVVLTAGWRATGTEANTATPPETFTNSIYGTCTFPEPPAGDPNFIPFANLTQAEVNNWVWANGVSQEATETAINNNLNLQINPLVTQPKLPWLA
jgi:hypothetical protein